ncbi:hypothetical protein HK098_004236 [Nowakowskiella sp. JEL0407]|nr:hypothetical protein HK098_004236 [Nowakowskiella sp. JEL0407]
MSHFEQDVPDTSLLCKDPTLSDLHDDEKKDELTTGLNNLHSSESINYHNHLPEPQSHTTIYPTHEEDRTSREELSRKILISILTHILSLSLFTAFITVTVLFGAIKCDQPLLIFLGTITSLDLAIAPSTILDIFIELYPAVEFKLIVILARVLWFFIAFVKFCFLIAGGFGVLRSKTCGTLNPAVYYLTIASLSVFLVIVAVKTAISCYFLFGSARRNISDERSRRRERSRQFVLSFIETPKPGLSKSELKMLMVVEVRPEHKQIRSVQNKDSRNSLKSITRTSLESVTSKDAIVPASSATLNEELRVVGDFCSICQSAYEVGDKVRQLGCKHQFHKECIDVWLLDDPRHGRTGHRRCPLCKGNVLKPKVDF